MDFIFDAMILDFCFLATMTLKRSKSPRFLRASFLASLRAQDEAFQASAMPSAFHACEPARRCGVSRVLCAEILIFAALLSLCFARSHTCLLPS